MNPTPTERVAATVRAELGRRSMSQLDLSARTGIQRSTLNRKVTGQTQITIADLFVIADALDVAPSYLIEDARA